ncbi:uncharacterized protein LOC132199609 [Neocloeon triangulifer]|uniref:uncharacterized protein LOC132199609 n=1 Tax=Neocloeon triangulifer TaxID=2078957 RepID=UPI00286F98A3|nr:uncharacterized protein LOC132199609 [Neocloeon triangulifer]XP_059480569.1 uncharacterized protein LOC132199609 [Neocloeon triangulifer]XP_059480655.1 uncharacterized protein LOC132199609 [Neocloeon triangulifer]
MMADSIIEDEEIRETLIVRGKKWKFKNGHEKEPTAKIKIRETNCLSRPKEYTNANFGYFDDDIANQSTDTSVLVVHYQFEGDAANERVGNEVDLKRLADTFEAKRNCRFRAVRSPEKIDLLELLDDKNKLLHLFDLNEEPSVFLLFILSHGTRNGKIFTDHKDKVTGEYEQFTSVQVIESLKALKNSLKVVFFGPCRGEIDDEIHNPSFDNQLLNNQNSCRISNFPGYDDFILVFSTVETTKAKRSEENGTSLVQATCEILDSLHHDASLEVVLTDVQNKIHSMPDDVGQTPEIKFSPCRNFTISKCFTQALSKCTLKNKYYTWLSASGQPVRGRWAAVVYETLDKQVTKTEKLLRENLDFETCLVQNSATHLEDLWQKVTADEESDVGCVTVCYFAKLSVSKDAQICVWMEGNEVPVGFLVQNFVGPINEKWIGRPKLFFIINQCTSSDDLKRERKLSIRATNHSGWFVIALPSTDSANRLLGMLGNPELKTNKSLQELAFSILQSERGQASKSVHPQIASTLHQLLTFPNWQRCFVEPTFLVSTANTSEESEMKLSFDKLRRLFLRQLEEENYCVWVVSAPAGMGKSTLLSEMEHHLRKELPDGKVLFRIPLIEQYDFLDKTPNTISIESILKMAKQLVLDAATVIAEKRAVIFLDGFDEICPEFRQKVLTLVKNIAGQRLPLWLTTRPQEEDAILNHLKGEVAVKKVEIRPFGRPDQLRLLKLSSAKSLDECNAVLDNFERVGASDILKNPFHLTLIADLVVGEETNLFAIFAKVVEKKVGEALVLKESYDRSSRLFPSKVRKRLELLQKFARCVLLNKGLADFDEENIFEINNTGIATVRSNKNVRFVHQTFAEFLLAQSFLTNLSSESELNFGNFELFQNSVKMEQVRVFVDSFFSDQKEAEMQENFTTFMKDKISPDLLVMMAKDSLVNIFQLIRPFITFSKDQNPDLKFIMDAFPILETACRSNETISLQLLEMGAHLQISDTEDRPSKLWALIHTTARNNFCQLFEKLISECPDISDVLRTRRNSYLPCEAVEKGHSQMLELLLANGANVDATRSNKSVLQTAIVAGDADSVRILVSHGAKLNPKPRDSWKRDMVLTPLHVAAINDNVDVCRCLVENGADIGAIVALGGWNALHCACNCGRIKNAEYFLGLGIFDVNSRTSHGRTPLILAVEGAHVDLVQFLLARGADLSAADRDGWNALHYAARYADLPTVRILLEKSSDLIEQKTKHGWMALQLALANSVSSEMKYFLVHSGADVSVTNKDGWNLLHWACFEGDADLAALLIDRMDVNAATAIGRTALHLAAEKGCVEIIGNLLAKGADCEIRDALGCTPLDLAATEGSANLLKRLVNIEQEEKPDIEKSHFEYSNTDVSVSKYVFSVLTLRGYLSENK